MFGDNVGVGLVGGRDDKKKKWRGLKSQNVIEPSVFNIEIGSITSSIWATKAKVPRDIPWHVLPFHGKPAHCGVKICSCKKKQQTNKKSEKAKTLPHFSGDKKFFFSHKLPPVPIKQPPDRPMRSTYRGKVLTWTQRIKTLGLIEGCKVFQHRRRQRAVSEELKSWKADFAPFLGRHEQFVYRVTGLPEFLPSR